MGDCQAIMSKHSGFIPAIILPNKDIEMTKQKFLLPRSENFGYCMASIRRHIKLKPSEAVFFMIDNKLVNTTQNIGDFYSQYKLNKKPANAFIYLQIIKEQTFGNQLRLVGAKPYFI
jgi:hypothetical protein